MALLTPLVLLIMLFTTSGGINISYRSTAVTSASRNAHKDTRDVFVAADSILIKYINDTVEELRSFELYNYNHFQQFPDNGIQAIDPDIKYNVSGLISSKGYPVQDYEIPTKDGFLLGMQRIQHGQNNLFIRGPRPAVLLQHGLLSSSVDWVSNLANESLGFILADAGFDVWLANSRGNTYSKKHRYLKEWQKKFWYWSWDEMAKYDLPAMVDFILDTTGHKQISYVGHSQGTTIGFAAFSTNKDLENKINMFVALAPVVNTRFITDVLRSLAHPEIYVPIVNTLAAIRRYEFLPLTWVSEWLARTLCADERTVIVCKAGMFLFDGYSPEHMNASRIPVYTAHSPAGTSIWNIEHWAQMVHAGQFAMFNYGPEGNLMHYGQIDPPLYNVRDVTVPVAMFSGRRDFLSDPIDVAKLTRQLRSIVFTKQIETYGHADFVVAQDARHYVYDDIVNLLNQVNNMI